MTLLSCNTQKCRKEAGGRGALQGDSSLQLSLARVCIGASNIAVQGMCSCPDPSHFLTPHPLSVSPSLHITCILSPDPYSSSNPLLLAPPVSVNKTSTVLLCPQVDYSFHYNSIIGLDQSEQATENLGYLCICLHNNYNEIIYSVILLHFCLLPCLTVLFQPSPLEFTVMKRASCTKPTRPNDGRTYQ